MKLLDFINGKYDETKRFPHISTAILSFFYGILSTISILLLKDKLGFGGSINAYLVLVVFGLVLVVFCSAIQYAFTLLLGWLVSLFTKNKKHVGIVANWISIYCILGTFFIIGVIYFTQ
ncbi:MAG: hypothetical protein COB84_01020 [Rhodobacteraceae bacterium]|nr:MAG: hypothetical protein COB84_01020 [Paracoccaceae bacterium]